jgi:predicted RNase H-like HicB family nuclease
MTMIYSDAPSRSFSEQRDSASASSRAVDSEQVFFSTDQPFDPEDVAFADPFDRLVSQWITLALQHARVRRLDDGRFFADIVALPGVWSDGDTKEEALDELPSVLADWVALKLADQDEDLPAMEGLDLVVRE